MLARRFTIVCLLAALFGLFLATLAADPGRSRRLHDGLPAITGKKFPADR